MQIMNVCQKECYIVVPSGKRTTNSHTSALRNISSHQDTDDVVATTDSEISLDGDQKELNLIGNDETTGSTGTHINYFY